MQRPNVLDAKARSVRSLQALARLALAPLEFEGPW